MASVTAVDYRTAAACLPAGSVLRADGVSWREYEQLLASLGEGYAVRIFYDRGQLEIMAPSEPHEMAKSYVHDLVVAIRDELDIDVESRGSWTLKSERIAQGAEADDCFYVQNAARIIGKGELNLAHDPPPDLAVEVERTNASLGKLAIYAALGVPELWRVTIGGARMFWLVDAGYEESEVSRAFPFLTAQALSRFLAQAQREGGRKATRAFRVWLSAHARI